MDYEVHYEEVQQQAAQVPISQKDEGICDLTRLGKHQIRSEKLKFKFMNIHELIIILPEIYIICKKFLTNSQRLFNHLCVLSFEHCYNVIKQTFSFSNTSVSTYFHVKYICATLRL